MPSRCRRSAVSCRPFGASSDQVEETGTTLRGDPCIGARWHRLPTGRQSAAACRGTGPPPGTPGLRGRMVAPGRLPDRQSLQVGPWWPFPGTGGRRSAASHGDRARKSVRGAAPPAKTGPGPWPRRRTAAVMRPSSRASVGPRTASNSRCQGPTRGGPGYLTAASRCQLCPSRWGGGGRAGRQRHRGGPVLPRQCRLGRTMPWRAQDSSFSLMPLAETSFAGHLLPSKPRAYGTRAGGAGSDE